jgi:hypothetical protein
MNPDKTADDHGLLSSTDSVNQDNHFHVLPALHSLSHVRELFVGGQRDQQPLFPGGIRGTFSVA